jgi:hypothetical protein
MNSDSVLKNRPGRRSPTLLITSSFNDELPNLDINYINDIVDKYFLLHSQITFVLNTYRTLRDVYSDIYRTFTNVDISGSTLTFDNSILLDGMDDMTPLQKSEDRKYSYHRPVLPDLKDPFQIPPVDVFLTNNKKFIFKKFKLFKQNDEVDIIYIQQLMLVIREIVMQLYGYYLNSNRVLDADEHGKNLVIIPKIYYVERKGNFIFVCMENIPIHPTEKLTFEKWGPIIKSVFDCFETNNLYHHDTAHRNIFLSTSGKLAVIDFGEAYVEYDNMDSMNKTESQPNGYFKDQTKETFTNWIEARNENHKEHEIYGGIKRKKLIRKKTKKRRGKKSKKNTRGTRRKK